MKLKEWLRKHAAEFIITIGVTAITFVALWTILLSQELQPTCAYSPHDTYSLNLLPLVTLFIICIFVGIAVYSVRSD